MTSDICVATSMIDTFLLSHGSETGVNGAIAIFLRKHREVIIEAICDCDFLFVEMTAALFAKSVTETEDDIVLYHLLSESEDFYSIFEVINDEIAS